MVALFPVLLHPSFSSVFDSAINVRLRWNKVHSVVPLCQRLILVLDFLSLSICSLSQRLCVVV